MLKKESSDEEVESDESALFNPFQAYLNIGRHHFFRKDFKRALAYLDKVSHIFFILILKFNF